MQTHKMVWIADVADADTYLSTTARFGIVSFGLFYSLRPSGIPMLNSFLMLVLIRSLPFSFADSLLSVMKIIREYPQL